MKLGKFIEKYKLPDNFPIERIPLKHPESGKKIYMVSNWFVGFWYKYNLARSQVYPFQYYGDIKDLEVHRDAKKDLEL